MRYFLCLLVLSFPVFAQISLDEMMSQRQKEKTGVDQLNYTQKKELEGWIDTNFSHKQDAPAQEGDTLYLSLNIDDGSKLELSDGSTYQIDPEDRLFTVYWITPIPLMLSESDSAEYPVKITNLNTGTSVRGKRISTREVIEESPENFVPSPKLPATPSEPKKTQPAQKSPTIKTPPQKESIPQKTTPKSQPKSNGQ